MVCIVKYTVIRHSIYELTDKHCNNKPLKLQAFFKILHTIFPAGHTKHKILYDGGKDCL